MDENTKNLVASNLTIAYFSFNPTVIMGFSKEKTGKRMTEFHDNPEQCVISVFQKFYDLLEEPSK